MSVKMPTYEVRVKVNGKQIKEIVQAPSHAIAKQMAEARTGGKYLGHRNLGIK